VRAPSAEGVNFPDRMNRVANHTFGEPSVCLQSGEPCVVHQTGTSRRGEMYGHFQIALCLLPRRVVALSSGFLGQICPLDGTARA